MRLLATGFDDTKINLTVSLFYILLPCMVINGLAVIWSAVLNATERFILAAGCPVIVPICVIFALGFRFDLSLIHVYAFAVLFGMILQLAVLAAGLKHQGISISMSLQNPGKAASKVGRQFLPMFIGAMLMSGTVLVDQAMATMLKAGSVAALGYGEKLIAMVTSIGSMAIGTAVLPYFSRMVAEGAMQEIRNTLSKFSMLIFALVLPITLFFICASKWIVALAFERGNFSASDATMVSHIFVMYSWQIPSFIISVLMVRLLSALGRNQVLMQAAMIGLPLNAILNYLFMIRWGAEGIALATSVVYLVNALFLWLNLRFLLKRAT
jgi:putative peptidoglycan lipid II flippase